MNTTGLLFRLTSFGESHGPAIGGVVDGMPPGLPISVEQIQHELDRRRPGQSHLTTPRREADQVELLSGIFEGKTTGTPIGFVVRNTSQHPADYEHLRQVYRPSHADYTYQMKYGIRDHQGGGRSSAREHIARVVGGALAKQYLATQGIAVRAYTQQVGTIALPQPYTHYRLEEAEAYPVRCPHAATAEQMERLIMQVKAQGDTIGGIVACVVTGCPVGLGEPVFGKLQARLAAAMMSINAAKGFDYGSGFEGLAQRGSEQNDAFCPDGHGGIATRTNRSGGIQGGISNGQDIYFRVAFKPVPTLLRVQDTVDIEGHPIQLTARGRHDACVLPRAVPVVEAMAAMVIADALLQHHARH